MQIQISEKHEDIQYDLSESPKQDTDVLVIHAFHEKPETEDEINRQKIVWFESGVMPGISIYQ